MNNILERVRIGDLVRVGNKLYTKEQLAAIDNANNKVEDFELQQMSKKLTLRH
jgi:hypothetical protein